MGLDWRRLLEKYGLADPGETLEAMELSLEPSMMAQLDSLESVRLKLDIAKTRNPEQLRILCSEVFRQKAELGAKAERPTDFANEIARLEVLLDHDGYAFDGFEIRSKKPPPEFGRFADQISEELLSTPTKVATGDKAIEHFRQAASYLAADNYVDCLTNLRLALKYVLEGVAKEQERRTSRPLPSEKESDVRNYLKDTGFFSEEEWRGYWGIYGLLSAGPHGKPDQRLALLAYTTCTMAYYYALMKLNQP